MMSEGDHRPLGLTGAIFVGGAIWALLVLLVGGCSNGERLAGDAGVPDAMRNVDAAIVVGGDRPAELLLPQRYEATKAYPLVLLLHPWMEPIGVARALRELGYHDLSRDHDMLLVLPRGKTEPLAFWNASPACCGGTSSTVDDVGYLTGLVDEISADYNVDPRRVFAVGRSNGGFMAHRLACDAAETFAAIVSLAGAALLDASQCKPTEGVSVLQIHGDADTLVEYEGGRLKASWGAFPGAIESVLQWAAHDSCSTELLEQQKRYDLDGKVPGVDTRVEQLECPPGLDVALWTIEGGGHWPDLSSGEFARLSWAWLAAHPKR